MSDQTSEPTNQADFVRKFCARMVTRLGYTFSDGDSVVTYATRTAQTYWDDPELRAEGPEDCADSEISELGLEQ